MQTFTGMAGVANGWQWSNRQPYGDYGNYSIQCSPLLLFQSSIGKHWFVFETRSGIKSKHVKKYFRGMLYMQKCR